MLPTALDQLRLETVRLVECEPYSLPLRQPWQTRHGRRTTREGLLVRVTGSSGHTGWGDCAPLPEAGTETLRAAMAEAAGLKPVVTGHILRRALTSLEALDAMPALRCAVEGALLDLAARTLERPLYRLLAPGRDGVVAANAAVGAMDDGLDSRTKTALDAGFRVLKVKCGVRTSDAELAALETMAGSLPDGVSLRLDANGAWDEPTAHAVVGGLATLPVEGLEEPLARPTLGGLARLQARCPWPVAVDESLAALTPRAVLDARPVRRLVLKPAVLGGPLACLEVAQAAADVGLECVVTSTLESAVGLWACTHLAAAVNDGRCHGLATGAWFLEDVAEAPAFPGGLLRLEDRPGLGVAPPPAP